MSETPTPVVRRSTPPLFLAAFIAAKVMHFGYLATWSWWWILMPIVPVIGSLMEWSAR